MLFKPTTDTIPLYFSVIIPLSLAIPFEGIALIPVIITGSTMHTGFWIGWLVASYVIQIIWMFILLPIAAYVSKELNLRQAVIIGVVTNIIHWSMGLSFLFY